MIKRFLTYRRQWLDETMHLSTGGFAHPVLQKIIAMGEEILPIIFLDLSHTVSLNNPIHWFYTLSQITGENPIKDDHLGDIYQMALDWLEWGQLNGYGYCIELKIKQ